MSGRRISPVVPALAAAIASAACSSPAPLPEIRVPERIYVQVPIACVPAAEMPAPPEIATPEQLLAMDRYRRTLTVWSERRALELYAREAAAVIEACARPP